MPGVFYLAFVVLWIVVLIEGVLLLLVYRHFGMMAMGKIESVQRDGPAVGQTAPSLTGMTIQGQEVIWTPEPGRAHLIAFVSPDCEPCVRILPHIIRLGVLNARLHVTLVVGGEFSRLTRLVDAFHLPADLDGLAVDVNQPFDSYQVRVTPFAFMIGPDGRIVAKGLCDAVPRLEHLLASAGLSGVVSISEAQPIPVLPFARRHDALARKAEIES